VKYSVFWTEGACHLGGSTVWVSIVVADGLRLSDVFSGLEVHGVGVFVVVFFTFFVLRFRFRFGVRGVFLACSLGGRGGAGSHSHRGCESLGGVLARVSIRSTAWVTRGI